jgi:hypothetical protein
MTIRRALLVVLWALSLAAAAQIGAAAQRWELPPPSPGVEVRFVPDPSHPQGARAGRLMAFLNRQWVPVTLIHDGGVVPVHEKSVSP